MATKPSATAAKWAAFTARASDQLFWNLPSLGRRRAVGRSGSSPLRKTPVEVRHINRHTGWHEIVAPDGSPSIQLQALNSQVMAGRTISHYRIGEKLGRLIALKFLPGP